jgi:hypothetical protein
MQGGGREWGGMEEQRKEQGEKAHGGRLCG